MPAPKILVFPGSLRAGSYNVRLAALAAKELALAEADVTRISLEDFPLPIYDANLEAKSGPPDNALKLKRMISAQQGVFIATPEYNASVTPLLKNAVDWVARVRERGEPPLSAYKNRVFALGAASPGRYGGMRAILAMRQVLEIGCGALVIPEFVSIANAADAFDDMDNLKDERAAGQLREVAQRLVALAQQVG